MYFLFSLGYNLLMRILVLDDDDMRHQYFAEELKGNDVIHVHTYDECVDALSNQEPFEVVFLDHDLNDYKYKSELVGAGLYGGTQEMDGRDVTCYMTTLLKDEQRPFQVIVHSWNPSGAEEMIATLKDGGYENVVRWEFDPAKKLFQK